MKYKKVVDTSTAFLYIEITKKPNITKKKGIKTMTPAYARYYVGIRDIMCLFNVGYPKAKNIYNNAKKLHSKTYSSLENQVLLEIVLEAQGIKNVDYWSRQQERKFKLLKSRTKK